MHSISNEQDKLVISKALDTMYLSEKRHCACFYGFLNEHEVQVIKNNVHLTDVCDFYGGYDGAKRVFFCVNAHDNESYPFVCAKITYKKEFELSHKDFLGAFMSLGIERSTIGDIIVYDGYALAFIKSDIFSYICNEITKIGRVGVDISLYEGENISVSDQFDKLQFTVSSNRLDVFVSALCHLSREKAQRVIKSDLVAVNYIIENNVSKTIRPGDVITIRKYGKFVFAEEDGYSKKGRTRVSVNHFR